MEQNSLRDLEQRCVQEELPYCQVACPLKVDGRAFCVAMGESKFDEARKILSRAMPFPDLVGRLCDAPCEGACLRAARGGAVALGALERACLHRTKPGALPLRLPSRGTRVTVLGLGLSSLVCALELAKKGHQVVLRGSGEVLGGLWAHHGALSPALWEDAGQLLRRLGVRREEGPPEHAAPPPGEAVYGGWDDPVGRAALPESWDPRTYATAVPGLFVGGAPRSGKPSAVWEAADGKRAAQSMDRFLQGASLLAGREKEFQTETRLFTPLEEVAVVPPREDPVEEARRCLRCECRVCVQECVFLEAHGRHPRAYAREIYNNFAVVHGCHQANGMINGCALCGLCQTLCPHDFSMAELCRSAREELVARGIMPPSAHAFALQDLAQARSPRAAGFRPGARGTTAVFFPGCQLAGVLPKRTEALVAFLDRRFDGRMGVLLGCCGAPAWWAARRDHLDPVLEELRSTLLSLGNPPVVLACPSCAEIFRRFLPEVPRRSLWEVLLEGELPAGAPRKEPWALSDPCATRDDPGWQEAVRLVLERMGQPYEELSMGRERTKCCGYGGLQSQGAPELARRGAKGRLQESPRNFLTYCAMCRESLSGFGKEVNHVVELFFPEIPAEPTTGFSGRQENRALLRERMVGPVGLPRESWEEVELAVSPEIRRVLEERRILDSDLRRVLEASRKQGRALVAEDGRHLASLRLGEVTFWVEYRPKERAVEIVNAWSHRMTVEVLP